MASWATKTRANYSSYLKRFSHFCKTKNIEPQNASFSTGKDFLTHMFHNDNANYGVIAVVRSALSAVIPTRNGMTFGKDPIVSRMLKGIFKQRPQFPRNFAIYDPDIVLSFISDMAADHM